MRIAIENTEEHDKGLLYPDVFIVVESDDLDAFEMIESLVKPALLGMGYSEKSLNEAFFENSDYERVQEEKSNDQIGNRAEAPIDKMGLPFRMFSGGRRSGDMYHTAACLYRGGMSKENILTILNVLADACVPVYPSEFLFEIIDTL